MKYLTRELILPYKEAQFVLVCTYYSLHCTIIIHLPLSSCYSAFHIKPGSQYDAGAASVMSVKGKSIFFTNQIASLMLIFRQSDWLDTG